MLTPEQELYNKLFGDEKFGEQKYVSTTALTATELEEVRKRELLKMCSAPLPSSEPICANDICKELHEINDNLKAINKTLHSLAGWR